MKEQESRSKCIMGWRAKGADAYWILIFFFHISLVYFIHVEEGWHLGDYVVSQGQEFSLISKFRPAPIGVGSR